MTDGSMSSGWGAAVDRDRAESPAEEAIRGGVRGGALAVGAKCEHEVRLHRVDHKHVGAAREEEPVTLLGRRSVGPLQGERRTQWVETLQYHCARKARAIDTLLGARGVSREQERAARSFEEAWVFASEPHGVRHALACAALRLLGARVAEGARSQLGQVGDAACRTEAAG